MYIIHMHDLLFPNHRTKNDFFVESRTNLLFIEYKKNEKTIHLIIVVVLKHPENKNGELLCSLCCSSNRT